MDVRWNYDVLLVIFNDLSVSDLAHAALVCHDWLPPARGLLYATITLDLGVPSVLSLVRTLRSFHHLRTLMRSLTVIVPFHATVKEDPLDWMPLLPSNTLYQFALEQPPTTAIDYYHSAMASPAVSTVSRLLLTGHFVTVEHLRHCMELPSLKSFSFSFPFAYDQSFTFNPEKQTLTRLSISAYCYCHNVHYILSSINATQLERFDLTVTSINRPNTSADNTDNFIAGIKRHCHSLQHLSIRSHYMASRPFLDNCIELFTNLRHLYCSDGTYTDDLLKHLPQSLRTLTLEVTFREPYPISHAKHIAAVRTQGHLSRLSAVTVVSKNGPPRLEDDKIWGIYRDAGLALYVSDDASVNLLA